MKKILLLFTSFLLISQVAYSAQDMEYIHKQAGVHIYKIDTKKLGSKIKPVAVNELTDARELYSSGKYRLVVNGGFFDSKSGDEVSFVTIDGSTVNSPFNNNKLISDLNSSGRLNDVLNRPELRIFHMPIDKYKFSIAPHFNVDIDKLYLIHSLQAGPMLSPYYTPELEGFVKYDPEGNVTFDSINISKRKCRTIIGLKGKYLYIIVFSNNKKMSGFELKKFVKKYRLKQAMALDGGSSTSLITEDVQIFSDSKDGRAVKSFLVIEK